jgi:hypothetical protein
MHEEACLLIYFELRVSWPIYGSAAQRIPASSARRIAGGIGEGRCLAQGRLSDLPGAHSGVLLWVKATTDSEETIWVNMDHAVTMQRQGTHQNLSEAPFAPILFGLLQTSRTRCHCCARAMSGHVAAPPSSVMNSRRCMCCPQPEDHTLPHWMEKKWRCAS